MNIIIEDYTTQKLSIETICKKYKIGKLKFKQILKDNNIPLNKKGGQIKYGTFNSIKEDYTSNSLECKECGKIYYDVENKSGGCIAHLQTCQPNIKIPTSFKRRMYLKTNGFHWHFQYFNLIPYVKSETLKCPECDWESVDINNVSGCFTKHIEKEHENIESFVQKYTEYNKLFVGYNKSIKREQFLGDDYVICKVCGEKMKYVNESHLSTHNMTLFDYKIKYIGDSFMSNSTVNRLKEVYEENLRHYEHSFKSQAEIEISTIIKDIGFNVLNNDKKTLNGTELDIFIPDLNFAIEYNGLFYHTEKMGKDKWYHLNKQNKAKEQNVNLIHIFEDEWLDKKEICVNKLIHLLGKNTNKKIYGRQTIVKKVNKEESTIFLNKNHIQGCPLQLTVSYGTYYKDELVGIMSFIKQETHWVLSRFTTNIKYRCIGISNKIFNHFLNEHNNPKVVSFADRRWTVNETNNLYVKMGFKLTKTYPPDYKYFNGKIARNKRLHKFLFRKKILLKKYSNLLKPEMTENEMTKLIGCEKIWDCGLYKYEYN